jgi:hypothetical protein
MSGYKAKTINKIISEKITDLANSIDDPAIRSIIEKKTIVTGGCIASMLLGEPVNDYDIYFRDIASAEAVANYYVGKFQIKARRGIPCKISVERKDDRIRIVVKSAGIASEDGTQKPYEYFEGRSDDAGAGYVSEVMNDAGTIEDAYHDTKDAVLATDDDGKPKYRPVFMSTNAITLSNRVQIVLRFFGEPDAIHENYDFVHCTNYWTGWDKDLILRPAALEALLSKELRYVGSRYPVCSVIRLRKFIKRGWSINAGQILKMMMQISSLDLTDPEVLQDQLTGVDSAYFCEILAKVKEKDPEKINSAYLIEIIDRMF